MISERKEHQEKIARALGGGRVFYENTDPIVIHKPQNFIMKFKNKLVDLCHGVI